MHEGWDFTFSENPWSTLNTMKQFICKIFLPYPHNKIFHLKLQEGQEIVWLLDWWSIHKDHDILDWMKETHLNISMIFILAHCANVL
jgi:hypothetical protein